MTKLGKRQHTFGTDWLYVTFVIILITIGFRIALAIPLRIGATIANPLSLLLALILFAFTAYYAKQFRPLFIIYDNGIRVIKNKTETTFQWSDIKRMDGTRQTTIYFAIPVKSGANHFYNESGKLFSVSFLTSHANNLVTFIISKMSEQQVSHYTDLIDKGQTISIGNTNPHPWLFWGQHKPVNISDSGIGTDKSWVTWDEIEHFTFSKEQEDPVVKVLTAKNKKYQKVAVVPNNSQYLLMGIIDDTLGTAYLAEAQEYILDYGQQRINLAKAFIKAAILVAVLMAVGIGIPVLYRASQGLPIFSP